MFELLADYAQIVIADLVLSGDNALIIGMAAAGLPSKRLAARTSRPSSTAADS